MAYTCVLDVDGKFEKKTTWGTMQEAQAWAVTHARIVPGTGKNTVTILDGDAVVKRIF
jgi:hypothetical protein